mmetsp:Transcript_1289/g.3627  ORF Transcript_1289/g.3627 Transcript_1289/m.3627 type:complete len:237 (-) Transcript_1289:364-1074(-)
MMSASGGVAGASPCISSPPLRKRDRFPFLPFLGLMCLGGGPSTLDFLPVPVTSLVKGEQSRTRGVEQVDDEEGDGDGDADRVGVGLGDGDPLAGLALAPLCSAASLLSLPAALLSIPPLVGVVDRGLEMPFSFRMASKIPCLSPSIWNERILFSGDVSRAKSPFLAELGDMSRAIFPSLSTMLTCCKSLSRASISSKEMCFCSDPRTEATRSIFDKNIDCANSRSKWALYILATST